MGACDFQSNGRGTSAKEAFASVTADARHEYGHGGYTGTIAEKTDFRMVTLPEGETADGYIRKLADAWETEGFKCDFNPFEDKWGPAGCIDLGNGEFVFFGSASS